MDKIINTNSDITKEPFVKSYPFMGPVTMSIIWWLVCFLIGLIQTVCFKKPIMYIINQYFLVTFIIYTWVLVFYVYVYLRTGMFTKPSELNLNVIDSRVSAVENKLDDFNNRLEEINNAIINQDKYNRMFDNAIYAKNKKGNLYYMLWRLGTLTSNQKNKVIRTTDV